MSEIEKDSLNTEETNETADTSETAEAAAETAEEASAEQPEEKDPVAELEEKVKTLEAAAAADKDKYLRLLAEYDNFRKRSQREKDALYLDCKASVIKELLPVADNFDRIFANPDISFEDYKKGVEMTFKQFENVFRDLKVESFGEEGEAFDPNFHNAVMHSEDENLGENVITNVFAKGYKVGDKVIRPAMVAVAN